MAMVPVKMLRLVTIISISTYFRSINILNFWTFHSAKQICPNSAAVVLSAARSLGIHFGITNCRMFRMRPGFRQWKNWCFRDVWGSVLRVARVLRSITFSVC
jgi:hypothetical protein